MPGPPGRSRTAARARRPAAAATPHPLGEDRVAPRVTEPAQFLVDPLHRDVGITRQQVGDRRFVGVELAAAPRRWSRQLLRADRSPRACSTWSSARRTVRRLIRRLLGDPPHRRTAAEEGHDLMNQGVVHGLMHLHGQVTGPLRHARRVACQPLRRSGPRPGDRPPPGTSNRGIPGSSPPTPAGPGAPPTAC